MSGVAGTHPRTAPAPSVALGEETGAVLVRLAVFAALALFVTGHWMALLEPTPTGKTLLLVLVATGIGVALAALGGPAARRRLGPKGVLLAALLVSVAGFLLALAAAGLPLRMFGPRNWAEIADGIDRGLAGIQSADWPYDGPDAWIRLTMLLGAAALTALAAVLAFFPAGRASALLNGGGLAALLAVYATAVSLRDPGTPLLRGLALLLLVGAWLWLPRLRAKEAAAGAALVLALGALSLPVAAALDNDDPWWDYHSWTLFGNGKSITFDWTHRYGPLDWPRDGTTLLNVRPGHSHYWKAETLDSFDGVRWVRGRDSDASQALQDIPDARTEDGSWEYFEWNDKWDDEVRFTVRSLSTDLLVGAGTPYLIQGAGFVSTAGDGTTRIGDGELQEGDSYTVRTYDPKPNARQMRGAPGGVSGALLEYTTIELPPERGSLQLGGTVILPLWGSTNFGDPEAPRTELAQSEYGDMYRIAERVTAGAPTMYDAVNRVDRYLNRNFTYSEKPRRAALPLNAFLFRDKFGYCQQFSGAMALMLRMAGIPARVVAGFAPGSFNRDSREYRVRDLDAHSWVEVYFNGIGWVTFDPTPAAAPAEAQAADLTSSSATGGAINGSQSGTAAPDRTSDGASSPAGGSEGGASPWLLLPLLLLGGAGLVAWRIVARSRRLGPEELAAAQLAELRRALARLDWNVPAGTTLLGLERRLDRVAGPAAARYAAGLRAHRYDPRTPAAPTLHDRRMLRRDLTARAGLRGRLVGLLAIPPGGPKPI